MQQLHLKVVVGQVQATRPLVLHPHQKLLDPLQLLFQRGVVLGSLMQPAIQRGALQLLLLQLLLEQGFVLACKLKLRACFR